MTTFALFGDSYIKRLRHYCDGDMAVPGRVYFYGKGRLRTDRLKTDPTAKELWKRCLRQEAGVYLINIGGNDITTTSEPEDIFERIVKLVDQLYRQRRVKMVYVAEIQTRGDFRGGLTKQEFDDQRLIINDLLRQRYHRYYVQFTDVRYPTDYDSDLVHLDSTERHRRNSGMRKYQSRIKRIFCSYKPHRRC